MSDRDSYRWLKDQIDTIRTRKFHVVDGPSEDVIRSVNAPELPESYKRFLNEFGKAKLFKQAQGYGLSVLATPRPAVDPNGDPLRQIGHYLTSRAYFADRDLAKGIEVPVYEWGANGLRKVAERFDDWITMRGKQLARKYGQRRWEQIVRGPKPFSPEEEEIVRARRAYNWRLLAPTNSGDLRFSVTNKSDRTLPYLSLGARSADGSFSGGIWLPVGHITPGTTGIVEKDCYKKYVAPESIEIFSLPDPEPEDREDYWEFRELPPTSSAET